jgi:hypothetical protein
MIADVGEKRGAAYVVTLQGYFVGLPCESVQRVLLRPPTSLEFVQVRGTLRAFSGRCTLAAVEEGTELVYHLEADPGIPMITDGAARQFLIQFLERMLDRVKLASERKTPSRRPVRQADEALSTMLPVFDDADESDQVPPKPTKPRTPSAEPSVASPRSRPAAPHRTPRPPRPAAPPAARPAPPSAAAPPASAGAPEGATGARKRRRRRRRRPGGGKGPGTAPAGGAGTS